MKYARFQKKCALIRPSKTGRIMLSPVAGGRVGGQAGGVPHSFSGAYLQDYASYGYETPGWIDLIKAERSAQEP